MKKIIFIALAFCNTGLHAQFKRPFFNTISVENGLPEAFVTTSLQDKLGYLWFGTQNGLVRYDGYGTILYPMPDDDGSPANYASISNLFEDKEGSLWAGVSNKGNYVYDRQKDVFVKAKAANAAMSKVLANNFAKFVYDKKNDAGWSLKFDNKLSNWSLELLDLAHGTVDSFNSVSRDRHLIPGKFCADILIDSSGNTWLATDSLLSIYDRASASFKPYFLLPSGMNKIMFNYIMQDPVNKDLLWISTALLDSSQDVNRAKIIQLNIKTKNYKTYDHVASDPNSIAGTCTEIYTAPLKGLFFYTDHGISMYNRAQDNFTNYLLSVPGFSAKDAIQIMSVAADKEGNLWIGGIFNGLFFLNTKTGAAIFYTHNEEAGSLPDFGLRQINKIFFDRAGILWVSMPSSGIAWLDPKRSFFNPVKINAPVKDGDKHSGTIANYIQGKYNDSTFFVAAGKEIFTWNHITNDFKNITPKQDKQAFTIGNSFTDKEGLIWMSSSGAGLFCYNPIARTTKNYRTDPKDSSSIGSNYPSRIIEDNDGNLWIGTYGNGLNSFNKKTGKFTRYPFIRNNTTIKPKNMLDDRTVFSLLCGKDGIIWIGTNLGSLNRFDPKAGKFTSYLDKKEGFNCIISLYEDSHNRLWVGSYVSGVFLVNKDSGFLKHLTERDGLSSNDVKGISEDKKGNIWFSTSHGLSKLNTENYQIINYTTLNGLPVVQTQGIDKSADGLFYISIKNGVIPFDPDNIVENKVSPQVIIESVKYHAAASNKDSILFTEALQQTELKYNENKISFQYVALHFSNALLNQYAYQLEGYDADWIQAGTDRTATYSNLSPGTYTFKVKAANSDGVWNEAGARFTFTILPPWWKTWWAYCLYALLLGGSIWIFISYRSKALRKENQVLEDKVNHRTSQLQKSLQDLQAAQSQLIQSEKMASLGELTAGIAHEIQNPLNFVNNFGEVNSELSDEIVEAAEKGNLDEVKIIAKDIKENSEKINHHGKRADAIVKGMLQHSRSSNSIKEPTNINKLADEYFRLAYHGLRAKDKSFNATLKTDFDESIADINIIPQDIGRVLLNLINNAFYVVDEKKKSGAENYEPTVSVTTKRINDKIEIKVSDNGNGIPESTISKIFQPFFTTKPTGQGTGLGLSLAYDIVKAHGGELKVESKAGEGSIFTIRLPQ